MSSIGSHEILGETRVLTDQGRGVCVGRPVENIRARIIKITDAPIATWADALELPAGEIGEIVVEGPAVTAEYFELPNATALAKIQKGSNIIHRMGDVGYIDSQGRLWFCGRKSQRVKLSTGDLFSAQVEGIFNAHPRVARSAARGDVTRVSGVIEPLVCIGAAERPMNSHRTACRLRLLGLEALGTVQKWPLSMNGRGVSATFSIIRGFRWTFATTRRSTASNWPSGRKGNLHEVPGHRRRRLFGAGGC